MKLLIVAWYFPPTNTIAAVRLGKMCKYLADKGHQVRVIAGKDLPFPQTLPLEVSESTVSYVPQVTVGFGLGPALGRLKALFGAGRAAARPAADGPADSVGGALGDAAGDTPAPSAARRVLSWLKASYVGAIEWPDKQNRWLPKTLKRGSALLRASRADLIFASGPPFTSLLLASLLSRRFGIPWVAEFRDRWHDDPYNPPPGWLGAIDRFAERRIVRSAAAIVTVSEPWAQTYRATYGKPTTVVYNGFDPEILDAAEPLNDPAAAGLRIVYTGRIYVGRRDPSPLFAALRLLPDANDRIRVEFYGTEPAHVLPLARAAGVAEAVAVHPPVTHEQAVRVQQGADILLLMQWDHEMERGNVPGKFFEYLGARRPILVLGPDHGVPATILRERAAGLCVNDPEAIAAQLRRWLEVKRREGRIPAAPEAARAGFSRAAQYRKLEAFLAGLVAAPAGDPGTKQAISAPDG